MAYQVIQWGTGAVGNEAVGGIIRHPDLELVGARVNSEAKAGRDIGEVCGFGPVGVTTTRDTDAILAMTADCVCFMGPRDWAVDPMPTFELLLQILRTGKNVANAWWPMLVNPRGVSDEIYQRLQEACLEGGSSIYTMGLDPGYGPLGLALSALNLTREVNTIHTFEFFNNGLWEGPDLGIFFGFGQTDVDKIPILAPGVTTKYHGSTVQLLAEAIGLELDQVVEENEVFFADEDFTVPAGYIAKGTISGVRYKVKGMVDGDARVVLDHIESIRDGDFPQFGFDGNGYRVEIEGEPCLRMDMVISDQPISVSTATTPGVYKAVGIGVAMAVVNAIPALCDAPPGVLTILDLPLFPAKRT